VWPWEPSQKALIVNTQRSQPKMDNQTYTLCLDNVS